MSKGTTTNIKVDVKLLDLNQFSKPAVQKGINKIVSNTANQIYKVYAVPVALVGLSAIAIYSIFNTLKDGADIAGLLGFVGDQAVSTVNSIGASTLKKMGVPESVVDYTIGDAGHDVQEAAQKVKSKIATIFG